ncbi:hypothetical protein [Teredinibacter sp. KSP-S5-2]|uniref:hypothetical protein n=1 Tax=Teredinibacter sp. KSP-S5-2 TaxID=3034506 RepID=UPI0029344787|nr:hypothetical protein [Teredinibacter sp. KSP-S5-2]WNO09461.1 hypothetical protein P5V12_21205 [Teredinibacter sp. KSP-S5-2]
MLKKIAFISLIIPASSWAYQFEGSLGYTESETTYDSYFLEYKRETRQYLSSLSYYFSPLHANQYPLDKLAFSQHASSLSIYQMREETEYEGDNEAKTDYNGGALRGVFANNLIFLAEQDENDSSTFKYESLSLGLGYYFADLQEVSAIYSKSEAKYKHSHTNNYEKTSYALRYEGLFPIGNSQHLNIDAAYSEDLNKDLTHPLYIDGGGGGSLIDEEEDDLNKSYLIAATYYPIQTFGVGVNYNRTTNNNIDIDSYQAEAKYYFTPSFALKIEAEYLSVTPNKGNYIETETNSLSATASFRF